jgi:lipopolysaccharide biosynthesis glycosyltransferase
VFIGWDATEWQAWNVAATSARYTSAAELDIHRVAMSHMSAQGLYWRPTSRADRGYWDAISQAPMSTAHAIARFLVPALCRYEGWALFTDGDVLFRRDVSDLFALADRACAVQVVQHHFEPAETVKMEGQSQTRYPRKNWSSVMLFNCAHPANRALTVELVNTAPGRDLHRFCWLDDASVGALPAAWNFLVGHSDPALDPAIVHFTQGVPNMPGYEHCAFSDEWYVAARACGYSLTRPPGDGQVRS